VEAAGIEPAYPAPALAGAANPTARPLGIRRGKPPWSDAQQGGFSYCGCFNRPNHNPSQDLPTHHARNYYFFLASLRILPSRAAICGDSYTPVMRPFAITSRQWLGESMTAVPSPGMPTRYSSVLLS